MKYIFDAEKSLKLKRERGVSFEEVSTAIYEDRVIKIIKHRNTTKYPLQEIMILEIQGYAWEVPFIQKDDCIVLKTAYPSRKATAKYLRKQESEND